MIGASSTLADVCFAVAAALNDANIHAVLTGGSAAAMYAPQAYMSDDADFVLVPDESLDAVADALRIIGFQREGRSRLFVHPNCAYTIDFPKGPLAVGGEYVTEAGVLERNERQLRILKQIDCVRDRLAHFYHWDDFTALNAAVAVAHGMDRATVLAEIQAWTVRESPNLIEKFSEFERRLRAAS